MVLFYHTFLALRFNGPKAPTPKKSEYWLDGEELLFSGLVAIAQQTLCLVTECGQ